MIKKFAIGDYFTLLLLNIDSLATTSLVQPDAWIDKAMHMGRIGMFNIIRWKWERWNLKTDGNFRQNLKERGVDGSGALPNYYYRDDGLLLWDAIHKYVTTVINSVYGECGFIAAQTRRRNAFCFKC